VKKVENFPCSAMYPAQKGNAEYSYASTCNK